MTLCRSYEIGAKKLEVCGKWLMTTSCEWINLDRVYVLSYAELDNGLVAIFARTDERDVIEIARCESEAQAFVCMNWIVVVSDSL